MDTKQLESLLAEATPGEWAVDGEDQGAAWGMAWYVHAAGNIFDCVADGVSTEANANLIALAPTLAREVIELRRKVEAAEKLAAALKNAWLYFPFGVVECRGDKCRNHWCASCFGWEAAEAYMSTVNRHSSDIREALAAWDAAQ